MSEIIALLIGIAFALIVIIILLAQDDKKVKFWQKKRKSH